MDQHRAGNTTAKCEWLLSLLPSLMMTFGKSMFTARRFQFPVHISAQGTEYSPLLGDSVLGHFLASLRELSPAAQTSDHAAASFSFSLAK